jgi:large subunit ribosomal protein L21
MYAIVDIAGQQIKVEKGQKVLVNRLQGETGSKVDFDKVLLIADDKKTALGDPVINGAQVTATIIEHLKGDKVFVFKKKRRKGYKKLNGHRQYLSLLEIEEIIEKGAKPKKEPKKAEKKEEVKEKEDKTKVAKPKAEAKKEKAPAKKVKDEAPKTEEVKKTKASATKAKTGEKKETKTAEPKAGADKKKTTKKAAPKAKEEGEKPKAKRSPAKKKTDEPEEKTGE